MDAIWGLLYEAKLIKLVYLDTFFYFAAMTIAVFFWTRYVIEYLHEKNIFIGILSIFGWSYLILDGLSLIVNFFYPVKYYFDSDGNYHACITRYIALGVQIFMFFITAIYVFVYAYKTKGKEKLRRRTIGGFGIVMTLFVLAQYFFPLLPLYSIGYLLGTSLIHTFVLEAEKEDYRKQLEDLISKEQMQKEEIGSTRKLAYTDSLTGVKNKRAFTEAQEEIQNALNCGLLTEFGIIVCDLNGLKEINDTQGHDFGDKYIKSASQIICNSFKHSPVYRIGGDEFVIFLRGQDYQNRDNLVNTFDKIMYENLLKNEIVIASGLDIYHADKQDTFQIVFERADKKMYARKKILKDIKGSV
jgi:diguanylate cyclase (GGDEF)-like protein